MNRVDKLYEIISEYFVVGVYLDQYKPEDPAIYLRGQWSIRDYRLVYLCQPSITLHHFSFILIILKSLYRFLSINLTVPDNAIN